MLRRVLAETFQSAWSLRCRCPQPALARETGKGEPAGAGPLRPLDPAGVRQEIEDRIERAMFIDRMAIDD